MVKSCLWGPIGRPPGSRAEGQGQARLHETKTSVWGEKGSLLGQMARWLLRAGLALACCPGLMTE